MMIKKKVLLITGFAALCLLNNSYVFSQSGKKIKTIIVDAGHGGKDAGAVADYENSYHTKEKDVTLAISLKLVAALKKMLPDVKIIPTRTTDIYQSPSEKAQIANDNNGDLFICIHADAANCKVRSRIVGYKTVTVYDVKRVKVSKKKWKTIRTPREVEKPILEYYKEETKRNGTSVWIFAPHKNNIKVDAIKDGLREDMIDEEFNIAGGADSALNKKDFTQTAELRAIAKLYAARYQQKSYKLAEMINDEVDQKTNRNALGTFQRQVGIWVLQATKMPAVLVETGFVTNSQDEQYLRSEEGQNEIAGNISSAVKKYKEDLEENGNGNDAVVAAPPVKTNTETLTKRNNNVLKKIVVKEKEFKLDIYDDGDVDGDNVSVYYNGKKIVDNVRLTAKALSLTLSADPALVENELVIYAENEGSVPPNTCLMVVTDGTRREEVRVTSDSKKNGVIIFSK